MKDQRVPVRAQGTLEAEVDGERVLLSPRDFTYFGLVGSGEHVWDLIDGQRDTDALVAELIRSLQAPAGTIERQATEFIDTLVAAGLVTWKET
ncbi:MAG: PqqD family protein [Candidatus Nanopelagicales bacterium]